MALFFYPQGRVNRRAAADRARTPSPRMDQPNGRLPPLEKRRSRRPDMRAAFCYLCAEIATALAGQSSWQQ